MLPWDSVKWNFIVLAINWTKEKSFYKNKKILTLFSFVMNLHI